VRHEQRVPNPAHPSSRTAAWVNRNWAPRYKEADRLGRVLGSSRAAHQDFAFRYRSADRVLIRELGGDDAGLQFVDPHTGPRVTSEAAAAGDLARFLTHTCRLSRESGGQRFTDHIQPT